MVLESDRAKPITPEAPPPWPLHGGRVIGRILKENGIKYAFGIQGGHIHTLEMGFYEHGVKRIHMRHEQAGVYAADAYARCSRTPGICYGTAGPGMTNMLSGINQAWLARSPIVCLFGEHPREQTIKGPLQEGHGAEMSRPMSKWSAYVDDWASIPLYLRKALRDSLLYPPGPVCLAMDPRTLRAGGTEADLKGDIPNSQKAWPTPPAGDPQAVEQAVRLLLASERPAMAAGDGVYWADAASELVELAELLQIPTAARRLGRGAIPENHPLAVKGAWRLQFWRDADLVVSIGLKLSNLENYGEPPSWPANAKRIIIHETASDAWAAIPCALEITGSPKLVLRQMIDCAKSLMKKPPRRTAWMEHLKATRKAFEDGVKESVAEVAQNKPIHGFHLGQEIANFLDPSATVIYDSYSGTSHLTDKLTATFPGQVLDSGEAAGVGHGIGMGIGAQLARPGKQVFVMMGDAGMGIGGMDIETASRHHLPVVYLVYNNSTWMGGIEEMYYRGQMDSWAMMPDIRYDEMFLPVGCHGEHVTEPDQIRPALYRAFNSGKTAVVNVIVDRRVMSVTQTSLMYRKMVMAAADVNKMAPIAREFALKGLTPEVEDKMRKAGLPPQRVKGKVSRHD